MHLADGTSLKLHGAEATMAQNASTVVVGTLQGSMYALPVAADWLTATLPAMLAPAVPASAAESSHGDDVNTGVTIPSAAPGAGLDIDNKHRQSHQQVLPDSLRRGTAQLVARVRHAEPAMMAQPADRAEVAASHGKADHVEKTDDKQHGGYAEEAGVTSKALMQIPTVPAVVQEAYWQCPVSLHSVVTSTAPQTFLPNLTQVSTEVEEITHTAAQTYWRGMARTECLCYMQHHAYMCMQPGHVQSSIAPRAYQTKALRQVVQGVVKRE